MKIIIIFRRDCSQFYNKILVTKVYVCEANITTFIEGEGIRNANYNYNVKISNLNSI